MCVEVACLVQVRCGGSKDGAPLQGAQGPSDRRGHQPGCTLAAQLLHGWHRASMGHPSCLLPSGNPQSPYIPLMSHPQSGNHVNSPQTVHVQT